MVVLVCNRSQIIANTICMETCIGCFGTDVNGYCLQRGPALPSITLNSEPVIISCSLNNGPVLISSGRGSGPVLISSCLNSEPVLI